VTAPPAAPYPPLEELLPHRPPMILLDWLVEWAPRRARCAVTLRPDSPFMENGRVRAVVAVEYMAQAIAACAGMEARQEGRPPGAGFLVGARDLELAVDHLSAGDALEVEAEYLQGNEQLASFRCRVRRGGRPVAAAVINVYLRDPGGEAAP
jgi:predicted hotdog family 3-hydroxylacyl-ACP dehydratase